jgi:cyclohexanecarboxylate-CoA ligase
MTGIVSGQLWGGQFSPLRREHLDQFRADGRWLNRTVRSVLAETAARHPARTALVGRRRDGGRAAMTYREFDQAASRTAAALAELGIAAGEVVAVMMPNTIEYPCFLFGLNEIGAVYTGIPVGYGERQALAVLRNSGATTLVIRRFWRSADCLALARTLREASPALQRIVIVADPGDVTLARGESCWPDLAATATGSFPPPAPEDICYLGFTSGTTGEPKGAMHTHETLLYPAQALAGHVGPGAFGEPMIQLVGSPVGHHTGFVWGVLFTVWLAGTGVHMDVWNPQWAAEIIREEQVTTLFGAPTFLQDLMRTTLAGDPACPLRCVVVAGSSVPRGLPARAAAALGAYIAPAWGMTECGILTSATPAAPEPIVRTDGSALAGSGVRVVDPGGADLPPGAVGDLLMTGPGVTIGYFDRADATREAFTEGLWFCTGDTATLDEHGWLELRGRTKDIIIRGGENIPVTDVETVILEHPDVLAAAVVAYPDERLGERACAVLVLAAGANMDLAQLSSHLLTSGLSKHYLPERILLADALPMTPSGKIQKFRLRELAAHDGPPTGDGQPARDGRAAGDRG